MPGRRGSHLISTTTQRSQFLLIPILKVRKWKVKEVRYLPTVVPSGLRTGGGTKIFQGTQKHGLRGINFNSVCQVSPYENRSDLEHAAGYLFPGSQKGVTTHPCQILLRCIVPRCKIPLAPQRGNSKYKYSCQECDCL